MTGLALRCGTPGPVVVMDGVWPGPESPIGLCEGCVVELGDAFHELELEP